MASCVSGAAYPNCSNSCLNMCMNTSQYWTNPNVYIVDQNGNPVPNPAPNTSYYVAANVLNNSDSSQTVQVNFYTSVPPSTSGGYSQVGTTVSITIQSSSQETAQSNATFTTGSSGQHFCLVATCGSSSYPAPAPPTSPNWGANSCQAAQQNFNVQSVAAGQTKVSHEFSVAADNKTTVHVKRVPIADHTAMLKSMNANPPAEAPADEHLYFARASGSADKKEANLGMKFSPASENDKHHALVIHPSKQRKSGTGALYFIEQSRGNASIGGIALLLLHQ